MLLAFTGMLRHIKEYENQTRGFLKVQKLKLDPAAMPPQVMQ
jgi:hypothetical protein